MISAAVNYHQDFVYTCASFPSFMEREEARRCARLLIIVTRGDERFLFGREINKYFFKKRATHTQL